MWRRLKEDWNQHYTRLDCLCRLDPAERRRMMDTPNGHFCFYCSNRRRWEGPSIQERRQFYPQDAFERGELRPRY
jgi:hypothetical protein